MSMLLGIDHNRNSGLQHCIDVFYFLVSQCQTACSPVPILRCEDIAFGAAAMEHDIAARTSTELSCISFILFIWIRYAH